MSEDKGLDEYLVMYVAIGALVLTAPLVLPILLPLVVIGWLAVKCFELAAKAGGGGDEEAD